MHVFIADIQMPERPKLHYVDRVPNYSNSQIKPPKMFKMLGLMRGPETVHNKLIHKQYGIQVNLMSLKYLLLLESRVSYYCHVNKFIYVVLNNYSYIFK